MEVGVDQGPCPTLVGGDRLLHVGPCVGVIAMGARGGLRHPVVALAPADIRGGARKIVRQGREVGLRVIGEAAAGAVAQGHLCAARGGIISVARQKPAIIGAVRRLLDPRHTTGRVIAGGDA